MCFGYVKHMKCYAPYSRYVKCVKYYVPYSGNMKHI
jgi:hypothetical protein